MNFCHVQTVSFAKVQQIKSPKESLSIPIGFRLNFPSLWDSQDLLGCKLGKECSRKQGLDVWWGHLTSMSSHPCLTHSPIPFLRAPTGSCRLEKERKHHNSLCSQPSVTDIYLKPYAELSTEFWSTRIMYTL